MTDWRLGFELLENDHLENFLCGVDWNPISYALSNRVDLRTE